MNRSSGTTHDQPLATHSLRVLIVTGIFPPDIGGPATYVPDISSELVKRGHQVTVVTLSDTLNHDDRSYSFRVHRIRRSLFQPLRFLLTMARILQRGQHVQVLYANGLYLETVVANWFLRKPLVQKIVGDWAWERASNKGWIKDNFEDFQRRTYSSKVEALKALRNFCLRYADAVIAPSRYLARWIGHWGVPEKKIAVIYNAVEPVSPSPFGDCVAMTNSRQYCHPERSEGSALKRPTTGDRRPREKQIFRRGVYPEHRRRAPQNDIATQSLEGEGKGEGLSSFAGVRSLSIPLSTRIKVVTVGRLVPWKQIDRLIEALCECDEAGLVIVGDGPERSRLEAIARDKRLTDRVYFAGQRSQAETLGLMAACDLFVLNSSYEGFPHVVLEAMSAGLPVVVTAVGGTPELVRDGENGLLIAPNANGALSKTLMKVLTSSEERKRLAAGAKETTQRFRRSAMIEATEAALRASA